MRAMRRSKGIIDVNIAKGSQFLTEILLVFGLFHAIPGVFKKHNLSVLHVFHGRLGIGTHHGIIRRKSHRLFKKLRKPLRHRL